MPSWHLADAAELAARHPYTFYKSPPAAIAPNTQQFMVVDE